MKDDPKLFEEMRRTLAGSHQFEKLVDGLWESACIHCGIAKSSLIQSCPPLEQQYWGPEGWHWRMSSWSQSYWDALEAKRLELGLPRRPD